MVPTLRSYLCIRVIDGDTILVCRNGQTKVHTVQLAAVSAPEKGEPYYNEATAALASLIEGKHLQAESSETDRFGREVCLLRCEGTEVNRAMVQLGWARFHHHYAEAADFTAEEAEAVAAKRGMWATLTPKSGEPAAEKEGTCLKVLDGDTIIFREAGAVDSIKIRLWGIDAPEKGQAFGAEATRKLARLIEHKSVLLRFHTDAKESNEGLDGYQRSLATIYRKGRNINLELVQGGYARHYAYYAAEETALAEAEQQARAARLGLWADAAAQEPKQYRREQKRAATGE